MVAVMLNPEDLLFEELEYPCCKVISWVLPDDLAAAKGWTL